jgi:hypothetical protein
MTIGNSNQHGVCWTIVSDRASRAMAYVGMTRARDENHLAIYPAVTNDAHQHTHGSDTVIHQTRPWHQTHCHPTLPNDPCQ